MRKHSSNLVENKLCADADSCCLVDRAVVTLVSQLWQTTETLRFLFASPLGCGEVFQAVLYTNCAKDVKMLRVALHKPASFWQGVITSQGAATSLLLKPLCLAGDTMLYNARALSTRWESVPRSWSLSLPPVCSHNSTDICFLLHTFRFI